MNKRGWVTGVFIAVLIIFAIILLVIPTPNVEQFDPDKHVCLKLENGIYNENECEGVWRWQELKLWGDQYLCFSEQEGDPFMCKEWRNKNICELEPEAEHPECVCLESETIRKIIDIPSEISVKYHLCREMDHIPLEECSKILPQRCTKARLRNICDDDPNHEDCECEEWEKDYMENYKDRCWKYEITLCQEKWDGMMGLESEGLFAYNIKQFDTDGNGVLNEGERNNQLLLMGGLKRCMQKCKEERVYDCFRVSEKNSCIKAHLKVKVEGKPCTTNADCHFEPKMLGEPFCVGGMLLQKERNYKCGFRSNVCETVEMERRLRDCKS